MNFLIIFSIILSLKTNGGLLGRAALRVSRTCLEVRRLTNEKLISVFKGYGICLNANDVVAREMPEEMKMLPVHMVPKEVRLSHIAHMCETAIDFVHEGRIEKAMRWLGFIQGSLYELGTYTINDLKDHSRPDPDDETSSGTDYFVVEISPHDLVTVGDPYSIDELMEAPSNWECHSWTRDERLRCGSMRCPLKGRCTDEPPDVA